MKLRNLRIIILMAFMLIMLFPSEVSSYGYGYYGYEVMDKNDTVWLDIVLRVEGTSYFDGDARTYTYKLTGMRFGVNMKIGSINITIYQTTSLRNGLYLTNTTTDIYHTSTDEYLLIDNYVFDSTGYVSALDNETYRTFLFKITAF